MYTHTLTHVCPHCFCGQLESVNLRARTFPIHLLLGQMYRAIGVTRAAIGSFREAVRANPYAVEASVALIELSPTANAELAPLLSSAGGVATKKDVSWLQNLAEAHTCERNHQLKQSQQLFRALDRTFPSNLYGKLQTAKVRARLAPLFVLSNIVSAQY